MANGSQWKLKGALALALPAVAGFVLIMRTTNLTEPASSNSRSLLAGAHENFSMVIDSGKWVHQPKYIIGLVLSVLVSLTSSVDRECGSSLYLVIFSVLLNLPFRNAIAMTAFTVALGSFAPGIASMSEPHLTERGVLCLLDYPSALLLLPTMFFGISWGVIINMLFPNWLLALLVVLVMTISNAQLLHSFIQIRQLRTEGKQLLRELHELTQQQQELASPVNSMSGKDPAADSAAACAGTATATSGVAAAGDVIISPRRQLSSDDVAEIEAHLRQHVESVTAKAHKIEGMALLYPCYHVPTVKEAVAGLKMDDEDAATARALEEDNEQLAAFRSGNRRFVFAWKKWWRLNNRFELSLVLKIVVLHLLTEFVRHKTTKPCTPRFWIMLGGVTGAVTLFLIFIVTSYNKKRLLRGPHWVDALLEVKQIRKQEAAAAAAEQQEDPSASGSGSGSITAPMPAAVAAGDAIAVGMDQKPHKSFSNRTAEAASGLQPQQDATGCWPRFKQRLPWSWRTAREAITCTSACNSYNNYSNCTRPRMLVVAAVTQAIGILGCALGLPAGPSMAALLLFLGIKPHVVAGSSRFLVMCFCFGSFVAYLIAGNVQSKLAAAYGLLNLGLAPLGLLLFKQLRVRSSIVLLISLAMGVLATVCLLVWQLVPLLAFAAGTYHSLPRTLQGPTTLGLSQSGDVFDINRFCHAKPH